MAKEFLFRGKKVDEVKAMSVDEFSKLITSRNRRKIKRGFTESEKHLLEKIRANDKNIKTHSRDMIVLPEMLGHTIQVHNGKRWVPVELTFEMVGQRLGEFALTRKIIKHSSPGIGATRSSSSLSVR